MAEQLSLTLSEWHKKQAIEAFNAAWDLIDKTDRTPEETRTMIDTAHASLYHWRFVGTEAELATGEWQISRVSALAGLGESALFHGESNLTYCEKGNLTPFDYTFAYEAIARAYHVLGKIEEKSCYLKKAAATAENIEDEEDKKYALGELNF